MTYRIGLSSSQSAKSAVAQEESSFPRKALIVPPLVPCAVLVVILCSGIFGVSGGGIHSGTGAFLAVVLWVSSIAAAIFELIFIPRAFLRFLRFERLQTVPNLLCLVAPFVFAILVVAWFVLSAVA